jgi:ribosome-associated protein
VRSLDDKKAEDLRVLDVRAQSSITDYLVLATGTSEPHLRALRIDLEKVIDGAGEPIIGMESSPGSGWTVFDAFDVMVHLFTAENRAKYRLELLWKDAIEIPVAGLLVKQPTLRRARRVKKATQATK